jgi:hypothetical protein
MRWLILLALAGCRPDYWIPAQAPIGAQAKADSVIAAVREDGKTVAVKAANLVPCDDVGVLPDGSKRVHGNLRKNAMWTAGVVLLVGGFLAEIPSLFTAMAGVCLSNGFGDGPMITCPSWTSAALVVGGIWATVNEVSMLIGPGLIAGGAHNSANEVPTMPSVQLKF